MSTEPEEVSGEQLRIKVAELCGWTEIGPSQLNRHCLVGRMPGDKFGRTLVPDYCNDLNACHEFEKMLTEKQKWLYMERLTVALGFDRELNTGLERGQYYWSIRHVKAEQLCKAFVATMEGK